MVWWDNNESAEFSDLVGKQLVAIDGLEAGSDNVFFECSDGSKYQMYHVQDCCESVNIVDVVGNPDHLLTGEILQAEISDSEEEPEGHYYESYTWTFYRIATNRGSVVIRWLGESNGYYSESVDFEKVASEDA